jgi:hypothetical protein
MEEALELCPVFAQAEKSKLDFYATPNAPMDTKESVLTVNRTVQLHSQTRVCFVDWYNTEEEAVMLGNSEILSSAQVECMIDANATMEMAIVRCGEQSSIPNASLDFTPLRAAFAGLILSIVPAMASNPILNSIFHVRNPSSLEILLP